MMATPKKCLLRLAISPVQCFFFFLVVLPTVVASAVAGSADVELAVGAFVGSVACADVGYPWVSELCAGVWVVLGDTGLGML